MSCADQPGSCPAGAVGVSRPAAAGTAAGTGTGAALGALFDWVVQPPSPAAGPCASTSGASIRHNPAASKHLPRITSCPPVADALPQCKASKHPQRIE